MTDMNIKSIFIPRQEYQYKQRPWAYVAFETEQLMHHVMEHDSIGFNDAALIWSPYDKSNKLWLHCGQSSHLYKDCPNKKPRSAPKVVSDKWQSTYNRFQPAGHKRAVFRSKSRTRGAPRHQGVSYASTVQSSTVAGGSMHDGSESLQPISNPHSHTCAASVRPAPTENSSTPHT